MSFCFVCPHCGRADAYSEKRRGNRVSCSLCEKPIWLPILSPGLRELEFCCPVCRHAHRVFLKLGGTAYECLCCKIKLIIPSQVYEEAIIIEKQIDCFSNKVPMNEILNECPEEKEEVIEMAKKSDQHRKKRNKRVPEGTWIEKIAPDKLVLLLILFIVLIFFAPKIIQAIKSSDNAKKRSHSNENSIEKNDKGLKNV